MRQLRNIIVIMVFAGFVLGVVGCVTGPSQPTYTKPQSEAEYWKEKYEEQRRENTVEGITNAMEEFSKGMEMITDNLDDYPRRRSGWR